MNDLYRFQYGLGNNNPSNGGKYPVYGSNGIIGSYNKYNNEDAPVIGHIGENCGSVTFAFGKHFVTYNGVMCLLNEGYNRYYGYCALSNKNLKSQTRGSSQTFISYDMLYEIDLVIPPKSINNKIGFYLNPLYENINLKKKEINFLIKVANLLLSKLATIEN
jgi:type I restriction enzyme S subunit